MTEPKPPRRSVDEHAARIATLLTPRLDALASQTVPLDAALGRVLAQAAQSRVASPPFRNSQMDGYAARAAEIASPPVTLPVAGVVPAGPAEHRALPPATLMRIMTGAPVPDGADCVVPVEDTALTPDGVEVHSAIASGVFVREAGVDLPAGGEVVPAGVLLAPRHLAAIAAAGLDSVEVRAQVRVAVLTTGAEVVAPGGSLAFGEIYDANRTALVGLVAQSGASVVMAELVDDDPGGFAAALDRAIESADLILTSGGISQGDWEVVRQVVEPRGVEITEIAMQPGGPQGSGMLAGVPILCFPGNPVSTQISFTVFVRGLLRAAAGLDPITPQHMELSAPLTSVPNKRQWQRGITDGGVTDNGTVRTVGGPGSHLVAALARADVLIDVPTEVLSLPAGATVTVVAL